MSRGDIPEGLGTPVCGVTDTQKDLMQAKTYSQDCPCGAGRYADCCARFHAGQATETAEQLMRARYSAYVLGQTDFLFQSWHPSTRPPLAELEEGHGGKWLGLEVKRHLPMGEEATVEFVARYKVSGRAHRLHEVSRFVREGGHWYYVDGRFPEK
jgi:SEC-C motif-containing protein